MRLAEPATLELPIVPLEGQLNVNKSFLDLVGMDFIEELCASLMFQAQPSAGIFNAVGRSYHVPLPKPVGIYDSVNVSGGGLVDMGIRTTDLKSSLVVYDKRPGGTMIVPPNADELFTGTTSYFQDGTIQYFKSTDPLGTYSQREAVKKATNLQQVSSVVREAGVDGLRLPIPAGSFAYTQVDQHGEPQTALLTLVPIRGMRLADALVIPNLAAGHGQDKIEGLALSDWIVEKYETAFSRDFLTITRGLAKIHQLGLAHNQPTAGNTGALHFTNGESAAYIADWESLTLPNERDLPFASALDILTAIRSSLQSVEALYKDGKVPISVYANVGTQIVRSFVLGYQSAGTIERYDEFEVMEAVFKTSNKQDRLRIIAKNLGYTV